MLALLLLFTNFVIKSPPGCFVWRGDHLDYFSPYAVMPINRRLITDHLPRRAARACAA